MRKGREGAMEMTGCGEGRRDVEGEGRRGDMKEAKEGEGSEGGEELS